MNTSLNYVFLRVRQRLGTRRSAIRRVAEADLLMPSPVRGEQYAGEKSLTRLCAPPTTGLPYYASQTVISLCLCLSFGLAGYIVANDPEPGKLTTGAAGLLLVMAAICGYFVVGKQYGPELITDERLVQANQQLQASGDHAHMPMSLLATVAMAVILLVDGTFSGFTLSYNAMASILSERAALAAALAWSVVISYLLWELATAAAREHAVNTRRATVRMLAMSGNAEDKKRAQAMRVQVGEALGHNYATSANRYRARILLALVVLTLTASTFFMRINAETETTRPEGATQEVRADFVPTDRYE